ncbi:MAG: DUF4395 domain-containing protein [Fluviicola sp.]|jgi:hypothetical protein
MLTGKSCPISGKKVNETVVRLIALQVLVLVLVSMYLNLYFIPLFLVIDFFLRGFLNGKGSVLRLIALFISKSLNLSAHFVDEKPKQFAAKVGFLASLILFVFQFQHFDLTALFIGSALIFFASLESFFAVCVGCILFQKFSHFSWFSVYSKN